jgi:predicted Zn-dependent protease
LAENPGVQAALSGLATIHRKNGRIAQAEKLERTVLRYRERNPYYLLSVARDELSNGNYKSARGHLKRAINIKDDEPELYELMAAVAKGQGLDAEAKRWLEKSKRNAS